WRRRFQRVEAVPLHASAAINNRRTPKRKKTKTQCCSDCTTVGCPRGRRECSFDRDFRKALGLAHRNRLQSAERVKGSASLFDEPGLNQRFLLRGIASDGAHI